MKQNDKELLPKENIKHLKRNFFKESLKLIEEIDNFKIAIEDFREERFGNG